MLTERKAQEGENVQSSIEGNPAGDLELSAALERIIRQTGMAPDSNPARLLSYIVAETNAGRADRLKAFTIGQDVFRRGPEFDASKDSIVRVEMKRLREILEHYYATAGEMDLVRISVPKGSYVPRLTRLVAPAQDAVQTVPEAGASGRSRRFGRSGSVLVAAAILCAAAFLYLSGFRSNSASGQGEPSLRIVVVDGTTSAAYGAASSILSRFSNIDLLTEGHESEAGRKADYELLLVPTDAATLAQLRVGETGLMLSSKVFADADFADGMNSSDFNSFQVWLGQAASRNGLIESDYVRRGAYSGDFTCSVLTEAYFADQTDAHHLAARDCILARIRDGHDSARLRVDLALLYREEHSDQRNLMPGDPLVRAAQEAQAAIALDRFDANAYYALMTVHFASGAVREGIAMGERSLELNPFDGEALGGFAARINYVGGHERALALFDASRKLTPGGVTWRDYGYFLAHLGMGDLQAAASAGIGLKGLDNELYLAAVAISASIRGNDTLARETKRTLLEREPDLRWMFERRAYDADLIDKIMRLLDSIQV